MGQAQIASIKYFRSFRFSLTPEDRVKYQIKIGGKEAENALLGDYELLNLSLSGFAFESDQILGPDTRVHLNIKLGNNSYDFVGLVVRAGRHREKRGIFTYGIKNSKDQMVNEKTFIEDLVSQFKTKRLRRELVNLLVNEVALDDPKREDILGLMIGLFADLRPFDDRGEFLELFMLQSKKVMQSEYVSLYLFSKEGGHQDQIKLLYPFQLAGRRVFPTANTVFESIRRNPKTVIIKDAQQILADPFYQNTPRHEGRVYHHLMLTPILNEDHEVVGIFECANFSANVLKEISYFEQYATLIGFLCADLCEKFSVVCPDEVYRESVVNKKKKKNIMIGESTHARELRAFVQRKKHDRQNYLLMGSAGCGKELLARIIHDESSQNQMPFGVVDVRDWDEQTCLEDLFLGDDEKVGKLELYSGGTLMIKNIDLLNSKQQEELMEYCNDKYSICFIASTYRDLEFCRKELNHDFLELIGGLDQSAPSKSLRQFQLKPLIQRENDLTTIAKYFIQEQCQLLGLLPKALSDKVLADFYRYSWPLNMVELKLAVARAVHDFQHARVIDHISRSVMPMFGNCQHQRQAFCQVVQNHEEQYTAQEKEQLKIDFQKKFCQKLVEKFGSAQKARQMMNISLEQWMEWSGSSTSKQDGRSAA